MSQRYLSSTRHEITLNLSYCVGLQATRRSSYGILSYRERNNNWSHGMHWMNISSRRDTRWWDVNDTLHEKIYPWCNEAWWLSQSRWCCFHFWFHGEGLGETDVNSGGEGWKMKAVEVMFTVKERDGKMKKRWKRYVRCGWELQRTRERENGECRRRQNRIIKWWTMYKIRRW